MGTAPTFVPKSCDRKRFSGGDPVGKKVRPSELPGISGDYVDENGKQIKNICSWDVLGSQIT